MTIGVLAAVLLAFLAAFRIDTSRGFPPFEGRQATTYESTARLFVTQQGFPWGRSALRYSTAPGQPPVVEGDPDRFASLALLYAQLANSGRVQGGLAKADRGKVVAKVVTVSQFSTAPLPLLDIAARAKTPVRARELAQQVTGSLVGFIKANQTQSKITKRERVVLEVIDRPKLGKVVGSPSPALPVLVLLTVLLVTVGGIFVLDNWRRPPVADDSDARDEAPDVEEQLPRIAPAASVSAAGGRRAASADARAQRRATLSSRAHEE